MLPTLYHMSSEQTFCELGHYGTEHAHCSQATAQPAGQATASQTAVQHTQAHASTMETPAPVTQLAAAQTQSSPHRMASQAPQQLEAIQAAPDLAAAAESQSELIASQAAELASARQAMLSMLQLLESGLADQDATGTAPQEQQEVQLDPSAQAAVPASAGSLQDLFAQLTQHLTESEPVAAAADELIADQGQLVASQGAELASARQALQLMTNLLEQAASSQPDVATVQQPGTGVLHAPMQLTENNVRRAMQQALAQLQPSIAAPATFNQGVQTQDLQVRSPA